jgi:uncharacterized protein
MRFENQPESSNVEDRRGMGGGMRGGGLPLGGIGRGGLGLGGLLLLLAIGWLTGINPLQLLDGGGSSSGYSSYEAPRESAGEAQLSSFVKKVLATTETCWSELFRQRLQRSYESPTLVLFRDGVESACGEQSASVGPFYCPGDAKLYIDLSFLAEMGRTLGASGDFAQAYVVAHEVGHHVQNLLGTNRRVAGLRGDSSERNRASVLLELQADYYAGVWAHHVRNMPTVRLDVDDYDEAIRAAQAVGDDVLQRRATGRVVPEKFTHGTAAQRSKWFRLGLESGNPLAHDPFVEER